MPGWRYDYLCLRRRSTTVARISTSQATVYAGVYPTEGEDYSDLREALDKLQLNDASLTFEPETSEALNFGFRCGFLGLFHMEIIQERLEREYDMDVVFTAPTVEYRVKLNNGELVKVSSPAELPDESLIEQIFEPWMDLTIFTPTEYYGVVMDLVRSKRGIFVSQEYPSPTRVQILCEIPLSELIIDFFDQLKSGTRGYASMDYYFKEYRPENLVKVEILVNGEPVDALTAIVHKNDAYHKGQALVSRLKGLIPRQLFTIPIQAYSQGRVISRANVKALRKDVLAKCYGGDITRKKKLLEKQKKGKRRMKMVGNVEIRRKPSWRSSDWINNGEEACHRRVTALADTIIDQRSGDLAGIASNRLPNVDLKFSADTLANVALCQYCLFPQLFFACILLAYPPETKSFLLGCFFHHGRRLFAE